ncbi:MAG: 2-hydroxyacid dehydrogenase [Alphaproteobacteria bacterium]|nr:2-hydroxyacid dehydrogenase [Alphaproteobacteria bacterium]MDP7427069.1 2-hydroxyacid dehydrogenase [Alphaproteobacteria bacterium]
MKVLLYGPIAQRGRELLHDHFGDRIEITGTLAGDPAEQQAAHFAAAEVIVSVRFDAAEPPAPRARLIQLPNSGLDSVDMAAVPEGCAVCNSFEHEIGISEYVMSAILQGIVELPARDAKFRAGDWSDSPRLMGPFRPELAGRTIVCVGYGNIGRAVAQRARAFRMTVHAVTRRPRDFDPAPDRLGAIDELDEMLPEADYVLVCCPEESPGTIGLIGAHRLALMKPQAVLLNVARGLIVDEDALYEALSQGRIGGAVIDVWYHYADIGNEDVKPSRHPFEKLDNVVMTPHCCGWTEGLMPRRFAIVAENIERLMAGKPLLHQVHPEI